MPKPQKKCPLPRCSTSPATAAYHNEFASMNPRICPVGCSAIENGSRLRFRSNAKTPIPVSLLVPQVATATIVLSAGQSKNTKQSNFLPFYEFPAALKNARLAKAQIFDFWIQPGRIYNLDLFGQPYAMGGQP